MTRPAQMAFALTSIPLCALAMLVGTLGLLVLPATPPLPWCAVGALALCLAFNRAAPAFLAPLGFALAAFLWTGWHARQVLEHRWPDSSSGERAIGMATIDSIPIRDASGVRFEASLSLESREPSSIRARVVWPDDPPPVQVGERWRVLIAIYPPRSRVNFFAQDGERHLFRERIHAVARVVRSPLNARVSHGHRLLGQWRERIVQRIDAQVADRDAAGLIAALAVGHTGGMSREQWRVFNATGTAHLVAISGLHVTLFAITAIALARVLWRGLSRWRIPPRETFAAALGLAAAGSYSVLAGFSVPTQRTLLMLGAWFAARAFARHATLSMPIAFALIAVLAIDPFAPLGAGFWLSFVAMSAIVLASSTRGRRNSTGETLRVQAAVSLALAPATLACFGGVSLAGIGINLIAIPVVSFVFVPLILLAVALMPLPQGSGALFGAATEVHQALWPWLQASADARHVMVFASPSTWWFGFAAIAAFIGTLPLPARLRIACVAWLVPILLAGREVPAGQLELTLLDTGRQPAVLVRTSGQLVVRGIGEGFGTDGRSIENALLPVLRAEALEHIDVLILERTGQPWQLAVNALLANVDVKRILVPASSPPLAQASACHAGARWHEGPITWRLTNPDCELEVSLGETRVWIFDRAVIVTTDSGERGGHLLLLAGASDPRVSKRVSTRFAAIRAASMLTTSGSGAITVRIGASGIERLHEARRTRRLWRVPPEH